MEHGLTGDVAAVEVSPGWELVAAVSAGDYFLVDVGAFAREVEGLKGGVGGVSFEGTQGGRRMCVCLTSFIFSESPCRLASIAWSCQATRRPDDSGFV